MNGKVDVRIEFANRENATFERSQWLDDLQAELHKRQVDCTAKKLPAPKNTQSLGLTEYLAIMAMFPSSISMLIDVLNYLNERNSSRRLSIRIKDIKGNCLEINNVSSQKVHVINEFNNSSCQQWVVIIND